MKRANKDSDAEDSDGQQEEVRAIDCERKWPYRET